MKWQSIQKPKVISHDKTVSTKSYGRFVVEPLEKGFGTTLGNALRRVLLSSMQGAAITALRIDGVLHEFSTIPGVVEDITEIILNLKGVRLRVKRDFPVPLHIEVDRKGEITAADIEGDPETTVINPEHHILTLSKKKKMRIDLEVGANKGYHLAKENKVEGLPLGTIFIDSVFSPIKRVNFQVEPTRVGQRTDYDKLILEIVTDGSLNPEEAITMASRVLIEHLELLIIPEAEMEQVQEEKVDEALLRIKNLLRMPVSELELSVRASNCLRAANIMTMADLVQKSEHEMLKYRNFGRKSLEELNRVLEELSLSFGMDVDQYFTDEELEEIHRLALEELLEKESSNKKSKSKSDQDEIDSDEEEIDETEDDSEDTDEAKDTDDDDNKDEE
ncbi:MAG: DNA-directed RNA polymerase subunit alpha [Candidatus Zixiibacteriota bacterium]